MEVVCLEHAHVVGSQSAADSTPVKLWQYYCILRLVSSPHPLAWKFVPVEAPTNASSRATCPSFVLRITSHDFTMSLCLSF